MTEDQKIIINARIEALKASIELSKNAKNGVTNTLLIQQAASLFYKWIMEKQEG